ncbi:MAG: response regulator [Elainellaceae cyanobacterium]
MRILLIEDDGILANILIDSLTGQRYVVDAVGDGQSGWDYAQDATYDLILMDVGLPHIDGITICQKLRSDGCTTPILLMTAKDASDERIRGLDAGADDYVIKPFDIEELQARVRALLRRGEVVQAPVLEVGLLRLDPSSCEVTHADRLLKLTPKEYGLLELFLRNPLRVFSRGQIVEHLWTFDDPPLEDSVKAHVKGLRNKLKRAGAVDWIENVYGIGYRLNPKIQELTSSGATEGAGHVDQQALACLCEARIAPSDSESSSRSTNQPFNQAMAGLWQRYTGLMIERMQALHLASNAAQSDTLTDELRDAAERAAHKLAGVLGMFARDDGTHLARTIETLLTHPDALSSERQHQLPPLVRELDVLLNLDSADASFPVSPTHSSGTSEDAGHPLDPSLLPLPLKMAQPRIEMVDSSDHLSSLTRILLIGVSADVVSALRALTPEETIQWIHMPTPQQAQDWLQSHSPSLAIVNTEMAGSWEQCLSLISNCAVRTPPIPTLVLAGDRLTNRLQIVRSGGQGILVNPALPSQIWEMAQHLLQQAQSLTASVLVVDDDPLFLAALRPLLEPWGIRMTGLSDPQQFWDRLQTTAPDLLVLDVEMPDISGIELCQAVRTDPIWQDLPILFLTAHRDSDTIQRGFAVGADDYVVKPIVGPELLTRITNRLERTRLLKRLSTIDSVTKLANQPQSSRQLQERLQRMAATQQPMCLAVLAIAQLRTINLQYGHEAGHRVLQRWGQLIQATFRGSDVVGYWGDGEFVIGMPRLKRSEAGDRLSELLTTLRQQIFTTSDGDRFQVEGSLAIAEYPTDGLTLQALYQANHQPSNILK